MVNCDTFITSCALAYRKLVIVHDVSVRHLYNYRYNYVCMSVYYHYQSQGHITVGPTV